MELILAKPVEKLIPELIEFNNKELLESVKKELLKYKGIIYDESSISLAKDDRAKLRKFEDDLNSERIRIKKVYEQPYNRFKAEVDEVIAVVNKVTVEIDTQVKDYERIAKDKKLCELKDYFNSLIGELAQFVPYEKIHKDNWLNVSVSLAKAQKEIEEIIEQIKKDLLTIEALNSEDETTVKSYYFRSLRLSDAIIEQKRLATEKQRILASQTKQEATAPIAEKKAESVAQEPVTEEAIYEIGFKVYATGTQLKALSKFLNDNNIKYSKI